MKMKMMLDKFACIPVRGHPDDAGLDLRAPKHMRVPAHDSVVIGTGVHLEIPKGYFGKLESKSGLNVKNGIVCCGGVIDSGYTGAIVVKLYNLSDNDYYIRGGDKIAQLIIQPCETPELELVDKLEGSERGNKGFGSTGR